LGFNKNVIKEPVRQKFIKDIKIRIAIGLKNGIELFLIFGCLLQRGL